MADKSDKTTKEEEEGMMKYLVESKVTSRTIMKDLDALDSFTEDWPHCGNLLATKLAIHIRCEQISNQCQGILDALEVFATAQEGHAFEEDFLTMLVSHEKAEGKLNQINALFPSIITASLSEDEEEELGAEQMKARVEAIGADLTEVKKSILGLKEVCGGMVVKWQTEILNKCILELQVIVDKIQAAGGS